MLYDRRQDHADEGVCDFTEVQLLGAQKRAHNIAHLALVNNPEQR